MTPNELDFMAHSVLESYGPTPYEPGQQPGKEYLAAMILVTSKYPDSYWRQLLNGGWELVLRESRYA